MVEAQALICRQYSSALRELRSGLITEQEFADYHQMLRNRAQGYRNDFECDRLAYGSTTIRAQAYLPEVLSRGLQGTLGARHRVNTQTAVDHDTAASDLPLMLAKSLMGQRRGKA
jgi:hypothetical protein